MPPVWVRLFQRSRPPDSAVGVRWEKPVSHRQTGESQNGTRLGVHSNRSLTLRNRELTELLPWGPGSRRTPRICFVRTNGHPHAFGPWQHLLRDFEFCSIDSDQLPRCSNLARSESTDQDRPNSSGRLTRPADQTRPKQFGRILRSPDQTSLIYRLVWSGRMIGGRVVTS